MLNPNEYGNECEVLSESESESESEIDSASSWNT